MLGAPAGALPVPLELDAAAALPLPAPASSGEEPGRVLESEADDMLFVLEAARPEQAVAATQSTSRAVSGEMSSLTAV